MDPKKIFLVMIFIVVTACSKNGGVSSSTTSSNTGGNPNVPTCSGYGSNYFTDELPCQANAQFTCQLQVMNGTNLSCWVRVVNPLTPACESVSWEYFSDETECRLSFGSRCTPKSVQIENTSRVCYSAAPLGRVSQDKLGALVNTPVYDSQSYSVITNGSKRLMASCPAGSRAMRRNATATPDCIIGVAPVTPSLATNGNPGFWQNPNGSIYAYYRFIQINEPRCLPDDGRDSNNCIRTYLPRAPVTVAVPGNASGSTFTPSPASSGPSVYQINESRREGNLWIVVSKGSAFL